MVMIGFLTGLLEAYNELISILPEHFKIVPPLFFIATTIALYSIFIWFFYRLLARRDVLKIDLMKYNAYKHSGILKFFRLMAYILEFMIIAPIVIFFWFAVLSMFLIILAKEIEVGTVILICSGLISAIRITAYFKGDLSKDLAKMIPFTLLGVAILNPNFLDMSTSIDRISQIPLFFNNAIYYFMFIVGLETVLRLVYLPLIVISSKDKSDEENNSEEMEKKESIKI